MTATQLPANDTLADTLVDRYIAAWNATDAAQRRRLADLKPAPRGELAFTAPLLLDGANGAL